MGTTALKLASSSAVDTVKLLRSAAAVPTAPVDAQGEECPICFGEMGNIAVTLPCHGSHKLCKTCLEKLVEKNCPQQGKTCECPICRGPFVLVNGVPIQPTDSGPAHAGPAQAGPAHAGPAHAGPAQAGPAHAGPAQAGPAQADVAPAHAPVPQVEEAEEGHVLASSCFSRAGEAAKGLWKKVQTSAAAALAGLRRRN